MNKKMIYLFFTLLQEVWLKKRKCRRIYKSNKSQTRNNCNSKINVNSTNNFSIPKYFFFHVDSKTNACGVALYRVFNIYCYISINVNIIPLYICFCNIFAC